jgi:glucosamine 6-phosphate synthetase-like amidotransferase/phosphosugar isomerase protein
LLSGWQPGVLGIAFFRPSPLFLPQYDVMPLYSSGQIAVVCLGVIDNLPEIREKLASYGYQFYSKENAVETLSLLLHNYLEYHHLPFVKAIQVMMTKLKGRFAIMALVANGKWFMVGCRDYPLAVGKNRCHPTVYFGTEPDTLAKFTPSMTSIGGDKKPEIFYGTSLQFEIDSPDSARWLTS